MARTNIPQRNTSTAPVTHEGASAVALTAEQKLYRSVLACMLWEHTFYEDGVDIAVRIRQLVKDVAPSTVAELAIMARKDMKLRHAPLLLTAALAYEHKSAPQVRPLVAQVVQRADELAELLMVLATVNGVGPDNLKSVLDDALKRGLADAFPKFDAYQLSKYNRAKAPVKLRDVLFLTHPKPVSGMQALHWKQLAEGTLPPPDTWEVALSTGGDKRAEFERLLREDKLGYMALLRNLRNMIEAGVEEPLIRDALLRTERARRVLPFRFVAAARHAPAFESELDVAMRAQVDAEAKLPGKTIVLVDVSASMVYAPVAARSDMTRLDAAAALSAAIPAEKLQVFTFSEDVVEVPPRRGMAGVDAVVDSQYHRTTFLGKAVKAMNTHDYDRLIVITDEQSHDRVGGPKGRAYMINVGSYDRSVAYGAWTRITGFSEAVINYIRTFEEAGVG